MTRGALVGRVLDAGTLPGGVALVMKAARKAGGWFVWASSGTLRKPVKVLEAKEAPDGKAVYEERTFERVLVKGEHCDGRRFVAAYVLEKQGWKADHAYVWTRRMRCLAPGNLLFFSDLDSATPSTPHEWDIEEPAWRSATLTEVKEYLS